MLNGVLCFRHASSIFRLTGSCTGRSSNMWSIVSGLVPHASHSMSFLLMHVVPSLILFSLLFWRLNVNLFRPILGINEWKNLPFFSSSHLCCQSSLILWFIMLYASVFPNLVLIVISLSKPSLAFASAFSLPRMPQCAGI